MDEQLVSERIFAEKSEGWTLSVEGNAESGKKATGKGGFSAPEFTGEEERLAPVRSEQQAIGSAFAEIFSTLSPSAAEQICHRALEKNFTVYIVSSQAEILNNKLSRNLSFFLVWKIANKL